MKRTGSGLMGVFLALVCITCQGSQHLGSLRDLERFTVQFKDLVAPEGVRNRLLDQQPAGVMTGRALHALRDFDGDGLTDLGVFELKGGTLRKMHFSYEVYLGQRAADGRIQFPEESDERIDCKGIPFDLIIADFDDDGILDVTFLVVEPGLARSISMLFTSVFADAISLDLKLYRVSFNGSLKKAATVRRVKTLTLGKPGEPAATYPEIFFRDVDYDGHSDLLVQTGADEFLRYTGGQEQGVFSRKPEIHGSETNND